jgi:hypothetical protein
MNGFRHSKPPVAEHGTKSTPTKLGSSSGKGGGGGFRHASVGAITPTAGTAVAKHIGPEVSAASAAKANRSGGSGFRHSKVVVTHGNPIATHKRDGDLFGYLGHFAGDKVLNDGHNTGPNGPEVTSAGETDKPANTAGADPAPDAGGVEGSTPPTVDGTPQAPATPRPFSRKERKLEGKTARAAVRSAQASGVGLDEAKAANQARKTGNTGLREAESVAGQAARQDVRFGSKLVRQARRDGGDVEQAKGLRTMATDANKARKVANRRVRPDLI